MILDNYKEFLDKLLADIKALGIDVSSLNLDHFAYQCSSDDDYDKLRPELETVAKLVQEAIVGGRRVGIFKLNSPLVYKERTIPAVELIAPKEGQVCESGLEHAEFVIPDFKSFIAKYPNLPWDISKLEQPVFPMITLKLSDNTQVKFHLKPVLEIVNSQ